MLNTWNLKTICWLAGAAELDQGMLLERPLRPGPATLTGKLLWRLQERRLLHSGIRSILMAQQMLSSTGGVPRMKTGHTQHRAQGLT